MGKQFSAKQKRKLDLLLAKKLTRSGRLPGIWKGGVKISSQSNWTLAQRKTAAAQIMSRWAKKPKHSESNAMVRAAVTKNRLAAAPSIPAIESAEKRRRFVQLSTEAKSDGFNFVWRANDMLSVIPRVNPHREALSKAVNACLQNQSKPNLNRLVEVMLAAEGY